VRHQALSGHLLQALFPTGEEKQELIQSSQHLHQVKVSSTFGTKLGGKKENNHRVLLGSSSPTSLPATKRILFIMMSKNSSKNSEQTKTHPQTLFLLFYKNKTKHMPVVKKMLNIIYRNY
jgi:hypothetical protein